MLDHLAARRGDRPKLLAVLDLGCGTGMVARKLVAEGHEVIGIDRSRASLKELRRTTPEVLAIRADAAHLPLADASQDAVLCLGAWRHLSEPGQAMAEIARVLREDGLCIIIGHFPPAPAGMVYARRGRWRSGLERLYRASCGEARLRGSRRRCVRAGDPAGRTGLF